MFLNSNELFIWLMENLIYPYSLVFALVNVRFYIDEHKVDIEILIVDQSKYERLRRQNIFKRLIVPICNFL